MSRERSHEARKKRIPVLYIDLDGTVRKGFDELGKFVNGPSDVELFEGIARRLQRYKRNGWRIVGVSNQGGIATGEVKYFDVVDAMKETQKQSGDAFDKIMFCPHHPNAQKEEDRLCFCRKPKIGLLMRGHDRLKEAYPNEMYPASMALMVGDRDEDRECARNAGIRFMLASVWREIPLKDIN